MASLNKCSGCDKNFAGSSIHAMHRTGTFGVDRRCFTTEELLAKGWTFQIEPVTILKDGKATRQDMETWYMPMTEERRASLDALKARNAKSDDETEEIEELPDDEP